MVLITRVTPPEHDLMYTAGNIRLKLGNEIIGSGTVYLTQEALAWQPTEIEEGISILWKQVSVHGISTNPTKCIYFMLDHKVDWPGVYQCNGTCNIANGHNAVPAAGIGDEPMEEQQPIVALNNDVDEGNETDEDDGDNADEAAGGAGGDYAEASEMTECWLLPAESELHTVDNIFRIMTECQAMHPDSADSISDEGSDYMDDDAGPAAAIINNYMQEEVGIAAARNGQAEAAAQGGMQNLSLDDDDDERFEDADEE